VDLEFGVSSQSASLPSVFSLTRYYSGCKIKERERGRTCGACGRGLMRRG